MSLLALIVSAAAAAGDPPAAMPPLSVLAVDPSGSVRVRLGPGTPGSGPAYLNFTLLRLRPGTGVGSEEAMLAGSEMVEVPGVPSDIEVFREDPAAAASAPRPVPGAGGAEEPPRSGAGSSAGPSSAIPAIGPYRLEVHRLREGVPEEETLAFAVLWRGEVKEWLQALEEERRNVLDLLAAWKGGGHEDDFVLLARIQELRFFAAPAGLLDVYRRQEEEIAMRTDELEKRPRDSRAPGPVDGNPSYGLLGVTARAASATASGPGASTPPGGGASPPSGAATGDPAGAGAGPDRARPEGPSIARVRRGLSREALAHVLLAAEHLALGASLPGQGNGGFADEWRLLAEACGRLTAEDPALREADKAVRESGLWTAVPPDATAEKIRTLDLKDLAKRARDLRARLAS